MVAHFKSLSFTIWIQETKKPDTFWKMLEPRNLTHFLHISQSPPQVRKLRPLRRSLTGETVLKTDSIVFYSETKAKHNSRSTYSKHIVVINHYQFENDNNDSFENLWDSAYHYQYPLSHTNHGLRWLEHVCPWQHCHSMDGPRLESFRVAEKIPFVAWQDAKAMHDAFSLAIDRVLR